MTTQNIAVKEQINPLEFTSAKPAWSSIKKKPHVNMSELRLKAKQLLGYITPLLNYEYDRHPNSPKTSTK